MKENSQKHRIKIKGIAANSLVIPVIVLLALLHIAIVLLILGINTQSGKLSKAMQESGMITETVTQIPSGASFLSETSANFIMMPETKEGQPNVGPLIAFTQELGSGRRGYQVLEKFKTFNVSPEMVEELEVAANCADEILAAQEHAIALTVFDYPIPDIPELSELKLPVLTEEEKRMTPEERKFLEEELLYGEETSLNKSLLSEKTGTVLGQMKMQSAALAASTSESVNALRIWLWVITFAIIVVLVIIFAVLYRAVFSPLNRFSKLITSNSSLNEKTGFREVRLVALAYNGLLDRRKKLESILRSAAEIDSLTNLPNRYSYEKYLKELETADCALAVFAFDVNYLKHVNDTEGHDAGDRLLQNAAKCILSCFDDAKDDYKCFRIGGDEFEAILLNPEPNQAEDLVKLFIERQDEMHISISWGVSHSDKVSKENIHDLIKEADTRMYEQKKKMHVSRDYV